MQIRLNQDERNLISDDDDDDEDKLVKIWEATNEIKRGINKALNKLPKKQERGRLDKSSRKQRGLEIYAYVL